MVSKFLKESNYTVVLTGAGMSIESGFADFRSKQEGIWKKFDPVKLSSKRAIERYFDEFVEYYRLRIKQIKEYAPHIGHEILARWEKYDIVKSIITQNIDGFHQRAGSENVHEIHGSIAKLHCTRCNKVYSSEKYIEEDGTLCECGGYIRPSIVLLGENLPQKVLDTAYKEAQRAELFIVLGSSLQVAPSNLLPLVAKKRKAKLIIINEEPTKMDKYADIVINNRKVGEVLSEIDNELLA